MTGGALVPARLCPALVRDGLAGAGELGRFVDALAAPSGRSGRATRVVLDMGSSDSPVYGEWEQSAYNGYFGLVCCHPLSVSNHHGNCLVAKLPPCNVIV